MEKKLIKASQWCKSLNKPNQTIFQFNRTQMSHLCWKIHLIFEVLCYLLSCFFTGLWVSTREKSVTSVIPQFVFFLG